MRRALRQLHLWVGLALSVLLFILGVTGSALVYKEAYWRLVYPELRVKDPVLTAEAQTAGIAGAHAHFGEAVRSVKLPEPGVPAYHLYLEDGEAFLSLDGRRVIDRWLPDERAMAVLFDLHAHLMAGERGERVGGVIALLGTLLVISGVVLWWPTRRRFAIDNLVPRDLSARGLLLHHRDLGVVLTPILLLLLISGAMLVFYTSAQRLLNGAFGDPVPVAADLQGPVELSGTPANLGIVAAAQTALPDARIVFYYPPRAGATLHEFRMKRPCELHPNGRSYVYADAAGTVLGVVDACANPTGEKLVQASYPLHSGKTPSGLYKLLTFIGGIGLALLAASGALSYGKRLLKRR